MLIYSFYLYSFVLPKLAENTLLGRLWSSSGFLLLHLSFVRSRLFCCSLLLEGYGFCFRVYSTQRQPQGAPAFSDNMEMCAHLSALEVALAMLASCAQAGGQSSDLP